MPSVNPEALGLEALLSRAELSLTRVTVSNYRGQSRVVIATLDYRMAMSDLRHALALVLKAKEKGADVEAARRIVL